MNARRLRLLLSLYPPLWGAGIAVRRVSPDFRQVDVEMKLRVWNRNYVGTHYGGSLYSMTDPFYMLMLVENLGRDFVVWDRAASIRFKRPGRGTVRAEFRLSKERLASIRSEAIEQGKVRPRFQVLVQDGEGELIAEVEKELSVRWKGQ